MFVRLRCENFVSLCDIYEVFLFHMLYHKAYLFVCLFVYLLTCWFVSGAKNSFHFVTSTANICSHRRTPRRTRSVAAPSSIRSRSSSTREPVSPQTRRFGRSGLSLSALSRFGSTFVQTIRQVIWLMYCQKTCFRKMRLKFAYGLFSIKLNNPKR